jgi:hypothetical protein
MPADIHEQQMRAAAQAYICADAQQQQHASTATCIKAYMHPSG